MKKFILTENEKKRIINLYDGLITEETETLPSSIVEPTINSESVVYTKTKEMVDSVYKLLDYYEKTSDGKFIDKKTKSEVNLIDTGKYLKGKIEDFKNGITNDRTLDDKIKTETLNIIEKLINGKLKEFFGEYNNINAPLSKFDSYTGKKRV
jgi:hypothetical protein